MELIKEQNQSEQYAQNIKPQIQWRHFRNKMLIPVDNNLTVNDETNSASLEIKMKSVISNRGGMTVAFKQEEDGSWSYAAASCSDRDNFSKARGRTISAGRLNSEYYRITTEIPMTEEEFMSYLNNLYTRAFERNLKGSI